jgi:hypothetical protein
LRAGRPHQQSYAASDAASSPKICDFLRKYGLQSPPAVRLSDPARDGGVWRFGILADGRPIRFGGRGFDVLRGKEG